jgi:hypothetical protein
MKSILVIESLYKFSSKDLYNLRQKHKLDNHVFKILPEYVLRDNGKIDYAENWLQFTGFIENDPIEYFYLFNIYTTDPYLEIEIDNMGITEFWEDFNWIPIFEQLKSNDFSSFEAHLFPNVNHVLVSWEYSNSPIMTWKIYKDDEPEFKLNYIKPLNLENC